MRIGHCRESVHNINKIQNKSQIRQKMESGFPAQKAPQLPKVQEQLRSTNQLKSRGINGVEKKGSAHLH